MKTIYVLTLKIEDSETQKVYQRGQIALLDNNLASVISGINRLETGNDIGEYYQTYATQILNSGDLDNLTDGKYWDGVRWAQMYWDVDQLDVIQ